MSGKQIFIWSVAVGLALTGGLAGVAGLVIWIVAFHLLEKGYEAVEAFMKGWKSSKQSSTPTRQRPALYVVK